MFQYKKLLAVGAAALGLFAFQASPAGATGAGVGVFVGQAEIGTAESGFGYPIGLNPPCGEPPTPTGSPIGFCDGEEGEWTLTSILGVGVAADTNDSDAVVAGDMSITGHGTVGAGQFVDGAFCGASSGHDDGTGTVTVNGVAGGSISSNYQGVGWVQSAATVIVFDNVGTNGSGPIVAGVVSAIPPDPVTSPGASCLTKSAKTFTVVGASALVQP